MGRRATMAAAAAATQNPQNDRVPASSSPIPAPSAPAAKAAASEHTFRRRASDARADERSERAESGMTAIRRGHQKTASSWYLPSCEGYISAASRMLPRRVGIRSYDPMLFLSDEAARAIKDLQQLTPDPSADPVAVHAEASAAWIRYLIAPRGPDRGEIGAVVRSFARLSTVRPGAVPPAVDALLQSLLSSPQDPVADVNEWCSVYEGMKEPLLHQQVLVWLDQREPRVPGDLALLPGRLRGPGKLESGGTRRLDSDLDQALDNSQQAVADSPDDPFASYNRGNALLWEYKRNNTQKDLDEAIRRLRNASNVMTGAAEKTTALSSLGVALRHKYDATADRRILDESIEIQGLAVNMSSSADPERPGRLTSLSAVLQRPIPTHRRDQEPERRNRAGPVGRRHRPQG